MKPVEHRFTYQVFSLLIDLDDLDKASDSSFLFSVNKPNLVSFMERDHGHRDGTQLRGFVDELAKKNGLPVPHKILLWCNPRILGYTFNPISIYYCLDEKSEINLLIYQVHNTFGQSHCYVAEVTTSMPDEAVIKQSTDKRFYVSPFLDMDLSYHFRIHPPDDDLRIRILEKDQSGPILAATFSGRKKMFTTSNLLLGICQTLGLTWKIMAGIHFEALMLWLKGMNTRPRPAAPVADSFVEQEERLVAGE